MYVRRCLVAAVVLALGACSPGSPAPATSSPAGSGPPSATTASGPPPSSAPALPVSTPPVSAPPVSVPLALTIYGVAHAGEQPGCVLLNATDDRVYLLLGGDRQTITAGGQLAVTGMIVPGQLDAQCRDGIPFQVTSVRPD
jgi:hypothetical protein